MKLAALGLMHMGVRRPHGVAVALAMRRPLSPRVCSVGQQNLDGSQACDSDIDDLAGESASGDRRLLNELLYIRILEIPAEM